ncbi:MAG TPA: HAD family hydrolase [Planctomycetota bacterium]|nr:HAD family hydrolase [Planctomycetota bacterium]
MMTKLLVLDLDGTLLHSSGVLSPEAIRTIERCREAGITVVIATARPPRSSRMFYEQLRLNTPSIHYNGALICNFTTGEMLLHRPIPGALAAELHDAALQLDPAAVISLEVCDKWYMNRKMTAFKTETERIGFKPDHIGNLRQFFREPVTKVLISFPTVGVHVAWPKLGDIFDGRLSLTKAEEGIIQIMNGGVSKGSAVQFLMERLGVRPVETAAIGDAPNDIPMFQAVGLSIAMGNAYPETKAAAKHVTLTNDENGAAAAIEEYILDAKPTTAKA